MSDSMMKLQALTHAELTLAHIRLNRMITRSILFAFAGLTALVALGMLDVAAYQALIPHWGPAVSALAIGFVNAVVAVIFVAIAKQVGVNDSEEKLAEQMRDIAANDINRDVEELRVELTEITDSVRRVRNGLSAVSSIPALFSPLLGGLVKHKMGRRRR